MSLHAERGIVTTKPADIAARANVALTTYYKHFPNLDSLVRACTERGRQRNPPPDPATIAALPPGPGARVSMMVETLFRYYALREPWLFTGRTEVRFVPQLQQVMAGLAVTRDAFVREALTPAGASPGAVAVTTALVDFWAWHTLRREVGLTEDEVVRVVVTTIWRVVEIAGPGQGVDGPGQVASPF
ncbi:MAG: TetR/AcrR family transcriptional regulator [Candidatus Rokubacteria bacterium]|nr:TetR/AcrR family transcriptional regulator [Candidatus Rokubacteria bacterium]